MNHCLKALCKVIETEKFKSVALPRLATGVGGLDWKDVKPLMEKYLGHLSIPIYVYLVRHQRSHGEQFQPTLVPQHSSLNANQLSQVMFNGSGDNFSQLVAITSGINSGKFELVPSATAVNPSDILRLGDINQDGVVNVADISALMAALSDPTDYVKGTLKYAGTSTFVRGGASPGPDWSSDPSKLIRVADLNLDDSLTNTDIQSLISYIASGITGGRGGLTAVPEPGSIELLILGAIPGIWIACKKVGRNRKEFERTET